MRGIPPSGFDADRIRGDFPTLHQSVHGTKPLVYLDNAATSQKPRQVIDALTHYYTHDNSNVHRGVHALSQRATHAYESARGKVRDFINAESEKEIIFVRGCTEGVNLVANTFGEAFLRAGDEVIISHMEHHANIVPWQLLRDRLGIVLRIAPINKKGELIFEEYEKLLSGKTKLVSTVHVSNALGTINPVREIVESAHRAGAKVMLDGAQAVPHMPVDVRALDVDFYAFSGHKMCGPTGIGVVYGRKELLDEMPPWQGGGDMIDVVTFEKTTFGDTPHRFEAGTPHIAGAIGLGAAIDYLTGIGMDRIGAAERELLEYAAERLGGIRDLIIYGTARNKASVISFNVEGVHPHDLSAIMDMEGIATRVGHHCAQPLMQFFGVSATARASLAFYNNREDIDRFADALRKAIRMLK